MRHASAVPAQRQCTNVGFRAKRARLCGIWRTDGVIAVAINLGEAPNEFAASSYTNTATDVWARYNGIKQFARIPRSLM